MKRHQFSCLGWGLPQKDEFEDKFKYAEQDINGLNVEVSQLQHDLDTKPTYTSYASLLHNRCPSHKTNVTSPHINTNSLSILRPDPLGEQANTDFEPDLCAVI